MRDHSPHPIVCLCSDATETGSVSLAKLQQHAILLLKLNRAVHALLPIPLRPWCRVANVRQGVLVLETSNASWQMRLRYEHTKLLAALRVQILPSLWSINTRINPGLAIKPKFGTPNNNDRSRSRQLERPRGEKPRRLSVQSAASIHRVALRCEGKLKHALERLAELAGEQIPIPTHPRHRHQTANHAHDKRTIHP